VIWIYILGGALALVVVITWRYVYLKRLADQHGLDLAELVIRDLFGGYGAVHKQVANAAIARNEETTRQLEAEERRLSAEQARTVSVAGEAPNIATGIPSKE
jgi:hypothetical protein